MVKESRNLIFSILISVYSGSVIPKSVWILLDWMVLVEVVRAYVEFHIGY